MIQIRKLLQFLLERKALDDDDLEALAGWLLSKSSRKWYKYQCVAPGCTAVVFAIDETTECFCHDLKMKEVIE